MRVPPEALSPEQRDILAQYYRHFINGTQTSTHDDHEDNADADTTLVDNEVEGSGAAEEPKKGRGRPSGSDSWGAMLRLQKLNLDDWLVHHLRSNIHRDPLLFLDVQPLNSQPGEHTSPMDRFVYKYLSAQNFSIDNQRNQIIWLFSTLVIGDLGVAMFGPGANIRGAKSSELHEAVLRRCNAMSDAEKEFFGISNGEALDKNIRRMITMGDRLVWFCNGYSNGSLFFLGGVLTEYL